MLNKTVLNGADQLCHTQVFCLVWNFAKNVVSYGKIACELLLYYKKEKKTAVGVPTHMHS